MSEHGIIQEPVWYIENPPNLKRKKGSSHSTFQDLGEKFILCLGLVKSI